MGFEAIVRAYTRRMPLAAAVPLALVLVAAPTLAEPIEFETPPIELSAHERLPAAELTGPGWGIHDRVENDGFMNHWRIASDWGELAADGDRLLAVRRRELAALVALEEVTRSQAFLDSLEAAFTGPWKAARRVVEHPVQTAKAIPAGVTRMFRRYNRKARDRAAEAKQEARELREDVDEWRAKRAAREEAAAAPPAAGAGAGASGDAADADAEADREESRRGQLGEALEVARDVGEEASRYFQRKTGYRKARRGWAKALGVDPYSDNAALNRELFRVAVASAAGGFSLRFAGLPGVPGLSELGKVNDVVYDLDTLDLRLRNERIFASLGFDRSFTDPLYDGKAWNARLLTDLADAVEALRGVANLHALLAWAVEATTRDEARFQALVARAYADLHRSRPLAHLHEGIALVSAVVAGGPVVVAAAFDHLAWTEDWAETFAEVTALLAVEEAGRPIELHLDGDATDRVRRETAAAGVSLVENAF
ncbi:MAG TPA: hypothetical protein VGC00_08625 [Thermoanaerobaculia bacterium]